jgi:hypothetical protein
MTGVRSISTMPETPVTTASVLRRTLLFTVVCGPEAGRKRGRGGDSAAKKIESRAVRAAQRGS